ncbi:MAG: T9SS type A sorting domain-containing protein [Candidatus Stahlbacteria bacterium]|nr:T9SS type A sorting domain-containing protein [Candidatus Stahlbacteria bacterium]
MKKYLVLGVMVSLVWAQNVVAGTREDAFLEALRDTLAKLGNPWVAGHTGVSDLPMEEKAKLLSPSLVGDMPPVPPDRIRLSKQPKTLPPAEMDWRSYNGYFWMTPVKNQYPCGTCWAFAWVSTQEARTKIFRNTPLANPDLSEAFVAACNPYGYGCDTKSGDIDLGNWTRTYGIPDEECFPYNIGSDYAANHTWHSNCSNKCSDWQAKAAINKTTDWGYVSIADNNLKNEIMNGPVAVAGYWPDSEKKDGGIREDFFYYKSGTYRPILGDWIKAGHAITYCGWNAAGEWLIKNSWGTSWGNGGYGYITYTKWWSTWMKPRTDLRIDLTNISFTEPNDGVWNPGDTITIVATIKAVSESFIDVVSTISTTDGKVVIFTGTATDSFGNISNGQSASNSIPCKVRAKTTATAHNVVFNLHLVADGSYTRDTTFIIPIVLTAVEEAEAIRDLLLTVTQNPTQKNTDISFALPFPSNVIIGVYDLTGKLIQTLQQGNFDAGTHTINWDTSTTSAGVFFIKLDTGKTTKVKKAIVF